MPLDELSVLLVAEDAFVVVVSLDPVVLDEVEPVSESFSD